MREKPLIFIFSHELIAKNVCWRTFFIKVVITTAMINQLVFLVSAKD